MLRPRVIYKAENRDTILSTLKFDWVGRNLVFFKHIFGQLEYELVILSADFPQRFVSQPILVQRPRDLVLDSNAGTLDSHIVLLKRDTSTYRV